VLIFSRACAPVSPYPPGVPDDVLVREHASEMSSHEKNRLGL